MIKAVIFDIDGVLVNTFEANLKFYQGLLAKNGYTEPSREEYRAHFHLAMIDAIKFFTQSNDEEEIQKIFTMGAERKHSYPYELVSSPKHMKETVAHLSQKYMLGIVTNKIRRNVFELPQLKEIENYFQQVITVDDTIKHKPDPEPLLLILQRLKISADEAVYIGDTRSDFQAAKAANIKFILFPQSDIEGVEIATSNFEELPNILEGL
jgi:HAD superfamily hydrolase (TIGR01509 family)